MIPMVNATFEEMVAFNNQLCDNKIAYFASVAEKLKAERASVQREISQLSSQNSLFMSLVEQDLIDSLLNSLASGVKNALNASIIAAKSLDCGSSPSSDEPSDAIFPSMLVCAT